MLDVPGLADYLAVSEKFVRRLVDQRRIPFRKVGRLVRFDPAEVAQWLASCKVDAVR
jgi:excisionase family DNA binding protein